MRLLRTTLTLPLLLSLLFAPLSGASAQDGDPKEREQIQAALKTARTYLETGKRESAVRLLKDIVLVYPKHPATAEVRKLLSSLTSQGGTDRPLSVPGKVTTAPKSAPALVAAIQKKTADASTLKIKFSLDCPAEELPFSGSGELTLSGKIRWKILWIGKNKLGQSARMEAWSDGRTVYSKGFEGKSPRPSNAPAPFVRQLRAFGSTSFTPLFYSFLYQKLGENETHTPTVSGVKDLGKETIRGVQARKVEYTVAYPSGKTVGVVAWIDESRQIPLKRVILFGGPAPLTETITSYVTGAAVPASEFGAPSKK